jgi:ribosomal-protein-alanine N-acetyltransferase
MLKLDLPILESERLILRPFRIEDASDMFEYASDPEVLKYLWWEVHPNIETTLNSIETRFMTANERGLPTA